MTWPCCEIEGLIGRAGEIADREFGDGKATPESWADDLDRMRIVVSERKVEIVGYVESDVRFQPY